MDINNYYFILEDGEPIAVDFQRWGEWIEADANFSKRRVAQTTVGDYEVSTIFLALDHRFAFMREGAPILFETLVFHGGEAVDGTMERYETLEAAMLGHKRAVANIKAGKLPSEDE